MVRTLATTVMLIATAALTGGTAIAVTGGTALAAAGQSARRAGKEGFRIISVSPTSRRLSVVATGIFTAGGTEVHGKTVSKEEFQNGTFQVVRRSHSASVSLSPGTCLFRETERGGFTLAHGTGRYAGISGSGWYVLRITGIYARNSRHQCGTRVAAFQQIIDQAGRVRL